MFDMPLTTFVILGIYMLYSADNFEQTKYSIFFGIISGLGMLVK